MLKEIAMWQVIKLFQGQLPSLTSQSHERAAKATGVTGASPCPRTDHADTNEEWASCGIHWAKWDFTAIQTPSSADSQARDTCPDTVTHSPHWMPNQHRTHSFSHLHIFIQHLSSWHGSPSILTFRSLWHSTNKSHNLGLISTRIHYYVWSEHCKILYTQGTFFYFFIRLKYLLTTPGRK